MNRQLFPLFYLLSLFAVQSLRAGDSPDSIAFGNAASEKEHSFAATNSETITGGLGESARRLLPNMLSSVSNWEGGVMSFTLKVDPDKPNFVTARFWGDEVTQNRMLLFADGRQIGYRHLGDIDQFDFGSEDPVYNGRFFYITTPLPPALTKGKQSIKFEIRGYGPIWGYGQTFEQYQKPMTSPTRATYALTSHTSAFFVPPADEKQGEVAAHPPIRITPGKEVLDAVKERVNAAIASILKSKQAPGQMEMQLLSRAWSVRWTLAYQRSEVIDRILSGLDESYRDFARNPKLAEAEPDTPNPGWFGTGIAAQALELLHEPLASHLDEQIDDGKGGKVTRRKAYAGMFVASRDWHRKNRRLYTNQTMINDLYGIYFNNRAVAVVAPDLALSNSEVMRYLYESLGLQPWTDSDPGGEGAKERDGKNWNVGKGYWELTDKGLSRELGYVGNYGEVIDWVTVIYNGTRPAPDQPGDPKIREQLIRIAMARSIFRYPMLDAQGNRTMRLETVIGWRDAHLPGDIVYGQRPSWDGNALESAAATLDPKLVGFARQMLNDNQYFASLVHEMESKNLRSTIGLLDAPDDYEAVQSIPETGLPTPLPMTEAQPDFVWSDEMDGVVAVKHGEEILYVSLYWRARNAVNFLARVHYLTPHFSQIAVVPEEIEFTPSGLSFTRPDWTNMGFGGGGQHYPGAAHSAHAGEVLPIAKIPEGVSIKPGDESVYAGRGEYYTMSYGPYLIAMNMTKEKEFKLTVPREMNGAIDLVTGKKITAGEIIPVAPHTTVVLHK